MPILCAWYEFVLALARHHTYWDIIHVNVSMHVVHTYSTVHAHKLVLLYCISMQTCSIRANNHTDVFTSFAHVIVPNA